MPDYRMLNGQAELLEGLLKAYEIKGDLPQYFESQVGLGVTLDDMREPEYRRLRRYQIAQGGDLVVAVAAQLGWSFVVPATSTRGVCVVEEVVVGNPTAGALTFEVGWAQIGATVTASNSALVRDDRMFTRTPGGPSYRGLYGVRSGTSAASPIAAGAGEVGVITVGPNSSLVLQPNAVITGNLMDTGAQAGWGIVARTVNVNLTFLWKWRERALLQSELT